MCPQLTRGLSRGMREEAQVRALQSFLARHYTYAESDLVTGYFGPVTESLVKRFQTEHGVPALGLVGPLTRSVIEKVCATLPVGPTLSISSPHGTAVFAAGDDIVVNWNVASTAPTLGMFVQLVTADTKEVVKSEFVNYASGTATLTTDEFCNGNFSDAIFGNCENLDELLVDGKRPMKMYAALFTPKDTCFGFCAPTTTTTTIVAKAMSSTFHMVGTVGDEFTVTRATGTAPLVTEFLIGKEGEFTLDFGDGQTKRVVVPGIRCITTPCTTPVKSVPHTYRRTGTYTATLTETVFNTCEPTEETVCAAWYSREEVIGTITIKVGSR